MEKFKLSFEERKYLGYYLDNSGHNYSENSSNESVFYYLDCEFVETIKGDQVVVLAIGNEKEDFIFKIKPRYKVTNYVTDVTGIDKNTKYDMTFDQAIDFLKTKINKNDILIGHHLYGDLKNLNFYHEHIIDCALMFPTPDGPPYYYSLKLLALMYLKINIQDGVHNALEDAKTAYNLVKFSLDNGFAKLCWLNIDKKYTVTKDNAIEIVKESLKIDENYLYCIYSKGSRPIGTNRVDSDYDLVVVCDKICNYIKGGLTKYGNIDICVYSTEEFQECLKYQYIWTLELIYCTHSYIFLEKINFREYVQNLRKTTDLTILNDYLSRSIGYETSRKIATSKKHYNNGECY